MRILIVTALMFLFWNTLLFSRNAHPAPSPLVASGDEDAQVQELLSDLGKKTGVTFTIEEALQKGHGPHAQLSPSDNSGRCGP
jgi:hypothetical protein